MSYLGICPECGGHLVGRCNQHGCPNNGQEAAATEITRLEAEVARLTRELAGYTRCAAISELVDENAWLREALGRWGRHTGECEALTGRPCSCGLSAALGVKGGGA